MGAQIAAYVLAGIAAVEAVALVVIWRRYARQQRELDELRQLTAEQRSLEDVSWRR